MLHLIVENQISQTPVMPVRVCLDKVMVDALVSRKARDPQVLLVIVQDSYTEQREIFPLTQEVHYVQFQKAGKFKILASIVWNEEGETWRTKSRFLSTRRDRYKYRVIDRYSKPLKFDFEHFYQHLGEAQIDVEIQDGFFAKKPWDWWWTSLWFETRPKDQCQNRRRRFISFTLQPILVAAWIILRFMIGLVQALAMFSVGRSVSLKPLFLPFREEYNEIWKSLRIHKRWFFHTKWTFMFKPIVLIPALIVGLIFTKAVADWSLLISTSATALGVIIVGLLFGMALGTVIELVFDVIISQISKLINSHKPKACPVDIAKQAKLELKRVEKRRKVDDKRRRKEENKQLDLQELKANLQRVLCDVVPSDIRTVQKRTIRLWYEETKAKVCKPFAA